MDINESIQRINQLTNKLSRSLNPIISVQDQIVQSVTPIIEYQEQIRQSISFASDLQNQIAQSISPMIDFQTKLSQILENNYNLSNYINSISLNLTPPIQNLISYQQDILDTISKFNFDISSSYISTEASIEFSQVVSDVLDEFNDMEIDEFTDASHEISTHNSSKTTLTWEQVLSIILAILTIISFAQDQLPNSHLINIEKAMYQIIEIEKQQLNLLE